MEFRVLGPIEVISETGPVEVTAPRLRSILARLLLADGGAVPATELIADLWSPNAAAKARPALLTHIATLRQKLEPDRSPRSASNVLITTPAGYVLRTDRFDAREFVATMAAAEQAAAEQRPDQARRLASDALGLWRGAAYGEFTENDWAVGAAVRLDQLRLRAVERAAQFTLDAGCPGETIADLQLHTAAHPLREEGWRLLALALYQAGQQGAALETLRSAKRRLAADLGVDPGIGLRELERAILAHDPAIAPVRSAPMTVGAVAARSPVEGGDTPVFVGRETETARLAGLAEQVAITGRIRLALIEGEVGIGKTALLSHLDRELAAAGWTCVHGRCPETDGAPAAWPWVELVSALSAAGHEFPATLRPLLAPLRRHAPTTADADTTSAQFRLHRDIVAYLSETARRSPLLVTLDDLHRADEATLTLLHTLAAGVVAAPILVVATYRPATTPSGEVTPFTDCLARLAPLRPFRWNLAGLAHSAVAELIRMVCRVHVDDDAVRSVADRTGGNPFFVTEIARMLELDASERELARIPPGVRDVIRLRCAAVPPHTQQALRCAAVLGRDAGHDILAAMLESDLDGLADALEPALAARLIVETDSGAIRFAHALVRDTVYEDMSRVRVLSHHVRAGLAFERLRPSNVAALSHHWLAAAAVPNPVPDVADKAVRYSRVAAEQAERQYAHHESARLWHAALSVHRGEARVRLELSLGLMRTLALSGQMAAATARRIEAVVLATELGDPHLVAQALVGLPPSAWVYRDKYTISDEIACALERILADPAFDDEAMRCRVLVTWAIELFHSTDRARRAAQEAYRIATALGDPQLQSLALTAILYQTHWRTGLSGPRRAISLQLRKLARRHGLTASEVIAELALLDAGCRVGDFAAADRHLNVVVRLATDHDLPLQIAECGWYRALRQVAADDIDGALAHGRRTVDEVGRLGGQWGLETATYDLIRIYWALSHGNMAAVLDLTTMLFAGWPGFAHVRFLHALALIAHHRWDEARKIVAEAEITNDYFLEMALSTSGRVGMALGDAARVEHAYRRLLPARDELVVMVCRHVLGPVAQELGDYAAYLGDRGAAVEHYRHAIVVARRAGSAFWADRARSGIETLMGTTSPVPERSALSRS